MGGYGCVFRGNPFQFDGGDVSVEWCSVRKVSTQEGEKSGGEETKTGMSFQTSQFEKVGLRKRKWKKNIHHHVKKNHRKKVPFGKEGALEEGNWSQPGRDSRILKGKKKKNEKVEGYKN